MNIFPICGETGISISTPFRQNAEGEGGGLFEWAEKSRRLFYLSQSLPPRPPFPISKLDVILPEWIDKLSHNKMSDLDLRYRP